MDISSPRLFLTIVVDKPRFFVYFIAVLDFWDWSYRLSFLRCGMYPHAFHGCPRELAKSQCSFDRILAAPWLGRYRKKFHEKKTQWDYIATELVSKGGRCQHVSDRAGQLLALSGWRKRGLFLLGFLPPQLNTGLLILRDPAMLTYGNVTWFWFLNLALMAKSARVFKITLVKSLHHHKV